MKNFSNNKNVYNDGEISEVKKSNLLLWLHKGC